MESLIVTGFQFSVLLILFITNSRLLGTKYNIMITIYLIVMGYMYLFSTCPSYS